MTSEIEKFMSSVDKLGSKLSAESIIQCHEGREDSSIGIGNLLMFLRKIELHQDKKVLRFRRIH